MLEMKARMRSPMKNKSTPSEKNHRPGGRLQRFIVTTVSICIVISLSWIHSCRISENKSEVIDDAFITYVYAQNVAEGHGIRYNPTDLTPTEGSSSLLHVLLLSLTNLAGLDPLTATRGLSLLFFITVPLIFGLTFGRIGKQPLHIGLLAAASVYLVFSLLQETIWHLTGGMETIFFLGIHAWVFAWVVTNMMNTYQWPSFTNSLLGIVLMILLSLCRPEGLVLAFLYITVIVIFRIFPTHGMNPWVRLRPIMGFLMGFAGGMCTIFILKYLYFGTFIPNSYFVKSSNAIFGSAGIFFPGEKEVIEFLIRRYIPLLLIIGVVAIWKKKNDEIWKPIICLVPSAVVVILYSRAIHEVSFGFRYEYPLLIPLIGCLIFYVGRVWTRSHKVFFLLFTLAILCVPFIGKVQDSLSFYALKQWARSPITSATGWMGYDYETGSELHPLAKMGLDLKETELRQQASILLSGAGLVTYYSRYRAIDWIGLNNNYLSGRTPRTLDEVWRYIDSQKPDVMYSVLPPATPGMAHRNEDPAFMSNIVQNHLKGRGSTLFPYWNKDIVAEMFYREMVYVLDYYKFGACYKIEEDWYLFAYIRKDSPHLEKIMNGLMHSKRANHDKDLAELYINDPRALGREKTNGLHNNSEFGGMRENVK